MLLQSVFFCKQKDEKNFNFLCFFENKTLILRQ